MAQTVYLDKHLSEILDQGTCEVAMRCIGKDFGKTCILQSSVLNKDEHSRYELLLNAISVENGWRSTR